MLLGKMYNIQCSYKETEEVLHVKKCKLSTGIFYFWGTYFPRLL